MSDFDKFGYHKSLRVGTELSHPEYRVLSVLWDYSSANGQDARPGHARLAKDCGMSLRSVERSIASLCEKGWIQRDRPGRSRGRNGGGLAAVYSLRTPPALQAATSDSDANDPPSGDESPANSSNHPPHQTESSATVDGPPDHLTPNHFPSECVASDHLPTEHMYLSDSYVRAREEAPSQESAATHGVGNTGSNRKEKRRRATDYGDTLSYTEEYEKQLLAEYLNQGDDYFCDDENVDAY